MKAACSLFGMILLSAMIGSASAQIVFEKVVTAGSKFVFPIVEGYGGVVPLPDAAEQPAKGSKIVFDVTAGPKEAGRPVPGLERAARLLNLAGACGLKARDLEIAVILHGDATIAALDDASFQAKSKRPHHSGLLIDRLLASGVKVMVCGQSLHRNGFDPKSVRPGITVAASAVSAVVNLQSRGYAYIPAHGP